jgi:hypothetical protein
VSRARFRGSPHTLREMSVLASCPCWHDYYDYGRDAWLDIANHTPSPFQAGDRLRATVFYALLAVRWIFHSGHGKSLIFWTIHNLEGVILHRA